MVEIPQTQTPLPSEEAQMRRPSAQTLGFDAPATEIRCDEQTRLLAAVARSLLNATADAALLVDLQGIILAANETAARSMGEALNSPATDAAHIGERNAYPAQSSLSGLIGACIYDLLPPECVTVTKAKISEAIATLLPIWFEDVKAGRHCNNRIQPVFDARGQLIALAIYESDTNFHLPVASPINACDLAIARSQTPAICRFKPDGTITFANPAYCRYFDKTLDRVMGTSFMPFLPEEAEHLKLQEHLASLTKENPVKTIEKRLVKSNGEIVWQQWNLRAIFDERGEAIEYQSVWQDITHRVLAEEALPEKQQCVPTVAEVIPNIIYLYDLLENRNVYTNRALTEILGVTPAEVQAMGEQFFTSLLHPEDLEKLPAWLEQIARAKDGEILEREYRMRKANGEWRTLWCRETIFTRNRDGSPRLFLGTAEDITERKQELLGLRAQEQMLQLVMDNIPQAIFWKDRNSVYAGCNQKFAKDAGVDCAPNIVGRTDYDLAWKKEEADFFRSCDVRVMETDTAEYHIIETQLQANGKQAWLDTNKIPLHDATGQIVGILGTYEDISDRRQIEEQLRATEERYELLVEGVKDYAIFMLDPEGRVISWNAGAERIKGYRADEILGAHYSCFYETEARLWGKPDKQLEAVAAMGRFEDEGWRVRKDGSRFWASVVMTALRDESGQLRGFAKVVRDITERRQAEEALQKANEQLGINVEVRTNELKIAIEQLHQEIAHSTQAEAELRKSEKQYRSVVDNLKEVIFQTDEVGLWTFLNPAWTEITGFSVEESLGKLFIDFVHPDDRQRNLELFAPLVVGQKDYCRHEIRYLTKNGSSRWLEVFVRQTLDDEGYAIGTAGTLNDITERKQAIAALRESEERFRRAFEDVATGMALVGIDGRYLQVNRAFCEMLGYSESELTATTFAALTHPDDLDMSLEIHRRVQTGEVLGQQMEKRYIHKDGHTVWGQLTTSLVCDPGGHPLYYVSQIQDITERNLALAQLRESEERFRQLAENVDEVFWIFNPDRSHLLYVSPMYESIWGRRSEQLYRSPISWLDAVHPEDRERLRLALVASRDAIARSRSIEVLLNEEYRIVRPDGSIRWIWERCFPVGNETGEVYRLCGVARDITGRKQAEEELRWALAKEKELSELRSRFVTMVSHEFRTPLATILSSADLLEYYFEQWPDDKNEKKLEHLQRIQTAAVTIAQMLNDVLIIGKADAGKIEFNPTPVDLVNFCSELVEEMQISALHTHTIAFAPDGAPSEGDRNRTSSPPPCLDEKLLRHILGNLLSNALKYSPNGGRVEFRLADRHERVLFQIRDFGIGIPPEDQPRLFEAFHRARNVGDIPGTGLGLAIVKRAVDIHGGQITIESEMGVGTTITVALPPIHSLKGVPEANSPPPQAQSTTKNTFDRLDLITNRSQFDAEDSSD